MASNPCGNSALGRGLVPCGFLFPPDRCFLVTISAEANESCGGIIEFRLSRTDPVFAPFAFEAVNIVTGSRRAAFLVGLGWQGRQGIVSRGQGAVNPFAVAVRERNHVTLFIESKLVVRQMVVHGNVFDMLPKALN